MIETTVGQVLVNEALPEALRDYNRVLDSKSLKQLLAQVGREYPEKYREVSHALNQVGRTASQAEGGMSFGLRHLKTSRAALEARRRIQSDVDRILADPRLSDKTREELIIRAAGRESEDLQKAVYQEALKDKNPLAMQVMSGARGKPVNLASLLSSDMLYTDHRDAVIPVPVLRSYSEGLSPEEYWAGTYGARRGIIATKFATADAGFLSKQLNQANHRLLIAGLDREDADTDVTVRGMPVDTDDMDNEGALLAADTGPFKKNTPLTPKILKYLSRTGKKRILVRSPIVGGDISGGVYARDVGLRETGQLLGRGEFVGLQAAQALSEPISQGQLSAKHSGGIAGADKVVGGFQYINQLIQVPKVMRGGAAHALRDGVVQHIEEAPAGGYHVTIDSESHYVPAGRELKIKKGDTIEAGDILSDGIPNPAVITEHKGVGEGRKYFVKAMSDAMRSAGMNGHRRNVELLARGLINHVRLDAETDDNVPGDVVPYSTLEHRYKPRAGHRVVRPEQAVGQYLERPVLHYTIGTKVRPSMLKELSEFGVNDLTVHADTPTFSPVMIRGMSSLQYDPDWMTQMYGSGLKGSLLDSAAHGSVSDTRSSSFVPSLAAGIEFGNQPDSLVVKPKAPYPVAPAPEIPDIPDIPDMNIMPAGVKLAEVLGDVASRRRALIIEGNPDRPGDPERMHVALERLLRNLNYEVQRVSSADYSDVPAADVAVGFSRGAGRLQYSDAPIRIGVGCNPKIEGVSRVNNRRDKVDLTSPDDFNLLPAATQRSHSSLTPRMQQQITDLVSAKTAEVVVPASRGDFKVRMDALKAQRERVHTAPTQAQLEAGNYRKGHVSINGLDITIENPVGSYRSGVDRHGKPWRTQMKNDYGYVKRSIGNDGDHVDVFLGPDLHSEMVFVVDQDNNGGGVFDEHKCMLGFVNQQAAKAAYLANYQSDWKGFQGITPMTFDAFKKWCFSGGTKKPMAKKADAGVPSIPAAPKLPAAPAAPAPAPAQAPVPAAPAPAQPQQWTSIAGAKSRFGQPANNPMSGVHSQLTAQVANQAEQSLPGVGGITAMGLMSSPSNMGKLIGFGQPRAPKSTADSLASDLVADVPIPAWRGVQARPAGSQTRPTLGGVGVAPGAVQPPQLAAPEGGGWAQMAMEGGKLLAPSTAGYYGLQAVYNKANLLPKSSVPLTTAAKQLASRSGLKQLAKTTVLDNVLGPGANTVATSAAPAWARGLAGLGGFTAYNAATELADAAGLDGTLGWDQQSHNKLLDDAYTQKQQGGTLDKILGHAQTTSQAFRNPLKSVQYVGETKKDQLSDLGLVPQWAGGAGLGNTKSNEKSRAMDSQTSAIQAAETTKQKALQQQMASPATTPEQYQQLQQQMEDSVAKAKAMEDESKDWSVGQGWLGGHRYRDAMHTTNTQLESQLKQLEHQQLGGTASPDWAARLDRLKSRKSNVESLLGQYDREVGYLGSGNFDESIRGRLAGKKNHLIELRQRMREPAVQSDPQLMQQLQLDLQSTGEELEQYRQWASQAG